MTKQIKAFVEANKIVSEQSKKLDTVFDRLMAKQSESYFVRVLNVLAKEPNQACKEALAETQEPVAWMDDYQKCKVINNELVCHSDLVFRMMQKYTTPPSREWVGLSDEEIDAIFPLGDDVDVLDVARGIEKALREKNG